eukprot:TRINITY_DN19399_c0_g1::TRINITY_DN19399_c0_g1_i1::g.7837::m.7837 TRINITY_DN19399_c0_g1::TRINITY_DN19399_c0_g1_i1::g.7837  ORF type:complete len:367 (+),score=76.95,sp/O08586/PTEN_MOUSE/40.88/5e-80,PTEN_C2/PF10409.4/6e-24,Y_phosphatase/PF00102.22/1.9e-06,CDKN3/PF05706.7/2.3e-05,Y_phosphatase3/PF13350.1/2.1e+03,Y_phosphatase3/PF13350.1/0.00011,DSPc/PF00782.15/5.6e-05,PTPlike_phytase/PF14566.1/0.00024,Y_phosphatase2/PF03162.8/0.025,BPL_N/PF09825.4/0.55,BPL_N/PF09825.4/4.9e+02 TRINITY_DN19399_c0_g1_i
MSDPDPHPEPAPSESAPVAVADDDDDDDDDYEESLQPLTSHGGIAAGLRHLVSKKKRRYQKDGYDLDLAYITDNILAMGFPSEGTEGVYRNPIDEVARFLNERHWQKYRIYNLCAERAYTTKKFYNRVALFPFEDHNTPPLDMLAEFCEDAENWMKQDPKNVIVIHCKAGKGRTGLMICCLLLHLQHNGMVKTSEVLEFYGQQRTYDGKGVTIASQIRYIEYYRRMLKSGFPSEIPNKRLDLIRMYTVPHFALLGGCDLTITIYCNFEEVCTARKGRVDKKEKRVDFETHNVDLCGDVKVEFYNEDAFGKQCMLYFCFNTAFVRGNSLLLKREEIDKANKDKKGHFDKDFRLGLFFASDVSRWFGD